MAARDLNGVGRLADERLVKIRAGIAPDMTRGSGWAIGNYGVLTAHHVIAPALIETGGECFAIPDARPGQAGFPCVVVWHDEQLDIALLAVGDNYRNGWTEHVEPAPGPTLAESGTKPVAVEAVGYPAASIAVDVPHPEQISGLLTPSGGAAGRPMPLDLSTSTPEDFSLWEGMSGAAVRDTTNRILGVVVETDHARQKRRLFVAAIPDPASNSDFREALIHVGATPVLEAANAPLIREALTSYDDGGRPYRLDQISDPGVFGARRSRTDIDTHGNSYYPYKRRELDDLLAAALARRADGTDSRMLLLVGDAMSGKSRAGAQGLLGQVDLSDRPVLIPKVGSDIASAVALVPPNGAVLWLDDLNNFSVDPAAFRYLKARRDLVVVATLRSDMLRTFRDSPELRPIWEVVMDSGLVEQFHFPEEWSAKDQQVLHDVEPHIRAKVADGLTLGEVLGAGKELSDHLTAADPFARAVACTIIDWALTGLPGGIPLETLEQLWPIYLPKKHAKTMKNIKDERGRRFGEAIRWLLTPVAETAITLVSRREDRPWPQGLNPSMNFVFGREYPWLLVPNVDRKYQEELSSVEQQQTNPPYGERYSPDDYLVANPIHGPKKIPDDVWLAAFELAKEEESGAIIYRLASNAHGDGSSFVAEQAYKLLVQKGRDIMTEDDAKFRRRMELDVALGPTLSLWLWTKSRSRNENFLPIWATPATPLLFEPVRPDTRSEDLWWAASAATSLATLLEEQGDQAGAAQAREEASNFQRQRQLPILTSWGRL